MHHEPQYQIKPDSYITITSTPRSGMISSFATTISSSPPTPNREQPGHNKSSCNYCLTASLISPLPKCRRGLIYAYRQKQRNWPLLKRKRTAEFSKPTSPSMHWFIRRRLNIYIGRDGRDVLWSMYNHHANANDKFYATLNDTPGRIGPRCFHRRMTFANIGTTGWIKTVILSGRSGKMSVPGGKFANCQICCWYISTISSAICLRKCVASLIFSTSRLTKPAGLISWNTVLSIG